MLLVDKLNYFTNDDVVNIPTDFSDEPLSANLKGNLDGFSFEVGASVQSQILGKGVVFVGAYSYINSSGYVRADEGGVFISRYCSIGRRVSIAAGRHLVSALSTSPILRGVSSRGYTDSESEFVKIDPPKRKTIIGNDVWIGDGVVLMGGVRIGHGAIVAANAVVTSDVEDYSIYAGVPARKIGMRFAPEIISFLLTTNWWECELSYLNSLPLKNIFDFINGYKYNPIHLKTFKIKKQ
ncbi:CatB-related O-acetyltransferase [Limnohabitans sp. 15K]|uniref:CatB-related O-acetyltransferase n=1 Tax=Limnohabitans sp. 15K TaxID=1100706 RepID=UPI000C1F5171|nr:CatB-related O-acetyltransferase [Limnohabitans sp. 15K]PIT82118.1 hypothetical protein B9Z40_11140 [Limnohabitans sp. 15K]